jgi:hypothetical protein
MSNNDNDNDENDHLERILEKFQQLMANFDKKLE